AGATARRFRTAFQARWNQAGSFRSANQYDTTYLIKEAIERAGSLQNTRLQQALARLDMPELSLPMVGGRIRFDRNHEAQFVMFVAQLGRDDASGSVRSRIVWPPSLATAE